MFNTIQVRIDSMIIAFERNGISEQYGASRGFSFTLVPTPFEYAKNIAIRPT